MRWQSADVDWKLFAVETFGVLGGDHCDWKLSDMI